MHMTKTGEEQFLATRKYYKPFALPRALTLKDRDLEKEAAETSRNAAHPSALDKSSIVNTSSSSS